MTVAERDFDEARQLLDNARLMNLILSTVEWPVTLMSDQSHPSGRSKPKCILTAIGETEL